MADDRFYVKSLTLENFRGFEKTELGPFDPHFNLLIGENGTGKSSVLAALAFLLRLSVPDHADAKPAFVPTDSDIRLLHEREPNGVVHSRRQRPARIFLSLETPTEPTELQIAIGAPAHEPVSSPKAPPRFPVVGAATGRLFSQELPVFAFYRADRANASFSYSAEESMIWATREAALYGWSSAGASPSGLREWFKTQTLAELQRLQRESSVDRQHSSRRISQLKLIVNAVSETFGGDVRVEFDADRNDIVLEFSDGSRRDFAGMSDGQRALFSLVADLARRVCLLNAPYLGEESLLRTLGIVLIDEIDLHLHPTWQRRIVGALKRIFPKIQFFATTHSPQVIGEAQPHEIVLLTADGKQKRPSQSFGMDSNWILECVMGAQGRDPEVGARIKSLFHALDEGRFEEARRLLEAVRDVIGEAPDVVAADAYLWNLGSSGEEAAE